MPASFKAIAVSLIGIVAIVILYFGNFSFKATENSTTANAGTEISFEDYEKLRLKELTEYARDTISIYKSSKNYGALAKYWAKYNIPLSGYYTFLLAEGKGHPEDYKIAGETFFSALSETTDTIIRNNLITFAVRSFEKSLALTEDIGTKLQLATLYVEATPEPMKGIGLLREITDSLPQNIPANMLLGRFAIMSGQFDKAEQRFNTILSQESGNAEALYFMAVTQEGLGHKDKAIELLEICKKIVNNEGFTAEINEYIKGLKNN